MSNEALIFALLAVIAILILLFLVLFFVQNQKQQSFLNALSENFSDNLSDKIYYFGKNIGDNIDKTNRNLNSNLQNIDTIFKNVLEKIAKIENSANLNLQIKDEISKLNKIMSNQKLRGNFGEYQLERVLSFVFGENHAFYELQKSLPNGKIADCALYFGGKILCIDSKFLLNNFEKICESKDKNELKFYEKELSKDIKKQIGNIAEKYIISGFTLDYAVLFIPSEAVFVYVNSNLSEILEYATSRSIFIASPSTILALFSTIKLFIRDEKIAQNSQNIKNSVLDLRKEFENFAKNIEILEKYAAKFHEQSEILNKKSKKISQKLENFADL